MSSATEQIRLDKWLWAARFYKTRSIARSMVDGGKVHYNGQRTKPSKIVELGATITLRQGQEEKIVTVINLLGQRRSAPEAQTLYSETAASIAKRAHHAEQRKLTEPNTTPQRSPHKNESLDINKLNHK